jgi:hypothetical protein
MFVGVGDSLPLGNSLSLENRSSRSRYIPRKVDLITPQAKMGMFDRVASLEENRSKGRLALFLL